MDEIALAPAAVPPMPAPPSAPARTPLRTWIVEGLRSAFLLPPRVAGQPTPVQLVALLLLSSALGLAAARLEIVDSAAFNVFGWLGPWWFVGAVALLVWALTWDLPAQPGKLAGLGSWLALWTVASVPASLVGDAVLALRAREWMPAALESSLPFAWGLWLMLAAWLVAVPVVLGHRFGMGAPRLAILVAALLAMSWVMATHFDYRPWYSDAPYEETEPRFSISQESFEAQQAAWNKAVAALAPQREGVRDVYGLVFAPYADEDVFLREGRMVAEVLAQRFDAQGRVLHLANHASTSETLPWATPLNLQRAVEAIAQRMDREHDVLVVYLTSHGARNFRLAARHWPLKVEDLTPAELRRVLDDAGVRHRVIGVSACYSGGWVGPLAGEHTLVMTAADPEHTSYGCGRRSELTFFGRALFDEQLRSTHSFEKAFAAAVPIIQKREEEAGKKDGFSNPQISVGPAIRPVLQEVERRLGAMPPT